MVRVNEKKHNQYHKEAATRSDDAVLQKIKVALTAKIRWSLEWQLNERLLKKCLYQICQMWLCDHARSNEFSEIAFARLKHSVTESASKYFVAKPHAIGIEGVSALGQKQTFACKKACPALPRKLAVCNQFAT